jgi:hypothetical protein
LTLVYKYGITLSQRNNTFYFFKRSVNFGLQIEYVEYYIKRRVENMKMTDKIKDFLNNEEMEKRIEYSASNRYREFYTNGYGVSIVPDIDNSMLFEVAVLIGSETDYDICYETAITDDVIKGLTILQAHEIAKQISELDPGATEKLN